MANIREELVNLIVEKTDMDEAQATSYISDAVKDIDDASIKVFYEEMLKKISKSGSLKLDGGSLNEIVQEVASSSKVYTKQRVILEKTRRVESQNKEIESLKNTLDESINKPEDEFSQQKIAASYNEFTKYIGNIPKEFLKKDFKKIEENVNKYSKLMPEAKPETINILALAEYRAKQEEDFLKALEANPENKKDPKKQKFEKMSYRVYTSAIDLLGIDNVNKSDFAIFSKETKREIEEEEKKGESQDPKKNYDTTEAWIISQTTFISRMIKDYELLVKNNPDEKHYKESLDRLKKQLQRHQEALEVYKSHKGKEKEDQEDNEYLDSNQGIKNTKGRVKDLKNKLLDCTRRKEALKEELEAETDPDKKYKLRKEYIKINNQERGIRNKIGFENVYGKELDSDILEQRKRAQNGEEFDMDIAILNYKEKLTQHTEERQNIQELRAMLNNPQITAQKRMDILLGIYNIEKDIMSKINILGSGVDHEMNRLQRDGVLTHDEIMEVEAYKIRNDATLSDEDKEKRLNGIKTISGSIDHLQDTVKKLESKGYSNKDIGDLLATIQGARTTMDFNSQKVFKGYTTLDLLKGTIFNNNGLPKEIVQDFFAEYDENEALLLMKSKNLAIIQALSEQTKGHKSLAIIEKQQAQRNGLIRSAQKTSIVSMRQEESSLVYMMNNPQIVNEASQKSDSSQQLETDQESRDE